MITLEEMRRRLGDKGSRGSKIRCHLLTSGSRDDVAQRLSALLPDVGGAVTADGVWMPDGFESVEEAQLDKHTGFLGEDSSAALRKWWLASKRQATTPNWDIVATFGLGDPSTRGLLLVEAKAHKGELSEDSKARPSGTAGSEANHEKIAQAIQEASEALSAVVPGFRLQRDKHYQISNRFAWAWKIAKLGTPVVLVYLGFLNAREMDTDSRSLLTDVQDWEETMREHCRGIIPHSAWNCRLGIGSAWVYPTMVVRQVDLPTA